MKGVLFKRFLTELIPELLDMVDEKKIALNPAYELSFLKKDTPEEGENWGMMRGIWASAARYTIVQMQDVLGLGSEGRINTPSTTGENWQWRATPGYLTQELAHRLYRMTKLYGRLRP